MITQKVTWREVQSLWDGYKTWSEILANINWVRGANIPEGISEAIVCICTKGELIREGHGDILLPNNQVGEVKATSLPQNKQDVSSFSPKAKFDKLFFVEILNKDDGIFLVYDLRMSRSDVERIKVNNTTTFLQHAKAGKRPRFSIRRQIILTRSLNPTWQVDVPNKKVRPIV
jgi:hypothetical protein